MRHIVITSVILVSLLPCAYAQNAERNADEKFGECGAISLYLLLNVGGARIDYQRVVDNLPPLVKDGYSLEELQSASSKLGLRLRGFKLTSETKRIDRPMIAMMRSEELGHYVVVRPVDRGSSLVQVLDPPFVPKIFPLDMLTANPAWTAITLQPVSLLEEVLYGTWTAWMIFGIIISALIIFKIMIMRSRVSSLSKSAVIGTVLKSGVMQTPNPP